jgi:class 3 adenylate cyclase
MIEKLSYVALYYNIDPLFKNVYLPYVTSTFDLTKTTETISSHAELYFLLKMTSIFMLAMYLYDLIYHIFNKIYDKNVTALTFIYIKYICGILIYPNMTISEYEIERVTMWAFTTPLMLKILSDENDVTMEELKIHYHFFAIIPHIFCVPFKNSHIYIASTIFLSVPGLLFLKTLFSYRHLRYTNLFILIWIIFMFINFLDLMKVVDPIIIHALYNLADTIFKFTFNFVICAENESEIFMQETMDLQSVNFISKVIKYMSKFENDNAKLSPFSKKLIQYYKKKFSEKLPKITSNLKLELLKKILPFDFDKNYMAINSGEMSGPKKEYNFVCTMFMDIVNYTELAKSYSDDVIFKMLDEIYYNFDEIIKKYSHLQKIETIGDSYMVVGDIFRSELNHKIVIKEIILLGLDFIKAIKSIKTPDKNKLCVRLGINIGPVSVGILGNEIPRLCVVGHTVNMASRLQSTADTDTIQISRHVYEHANEIDFGFDIDFVSKENVFLKNIGTTTTFVITPSKS